MQNHIYKQIIKKSNILYMYGQVINDNSDIIIKEINDSFEEHINIDEKKLINKKLKETALQNKEQWIDIIVSGLNKTNKNYYFVEDLKKWFNVTVEKLDNDEFYILLEERYKNNNFINELFKTLSFGAWYKDKDLRYINNRESKSEYSDAKCGEFYGKFDHEVIKDKNSAKEIIDEDEFMIGCRENLSYSKIVSNGKAYKVEKKVVYDEYGDVEGIVGYYIDVTKQSELKNKYSEYKKLSYNLLDSIEDCIAFKDCDGIIRYCNKSFLKHLGAKQFGQVIGEDYAKLKEKYVKGYDEYQIIDEQVKLTRAPLRYETTYTTNNQEKSLEIIKTPFLNISNEMDGIIAVIRDVSYKKIVENEVLKSQQQLLSILGGIDDAVILSDQGGILYINEAFEDITGISRQDYIKDTNIFYDLIEDEYKDLYNETWLDYDEPIKIKTKDSREKWVWYKNYCIQNSQNKEEKITIIRDITLKKQKEIELEKVRNDFLANITHELRTPLNLIFSTLQLIKLKARKLEVNLSEFEDNMNTLEQNSLRLLKLSNNLIDTTKIDAGYLDCHFEKGDIIYFLESIFNSIQPYANMRNIELIFDTDTEEEVISFDMDKIERVILNILSNAIKFNKDNGKIYMNIYKQEKELKIIIKDTGIGMTKNNLGNIFNRFNQVNNRMTKISEGSGIGLSLSKSLIEIHGGTIEVDSKLNEWTKFEIKIPINITEKDEIIKERSTKYNSLINKLDIEFSDIY